MMRRGLAIITGLGVALLPAACSRGAGGDDVPTVVVTRGDVSSDVHTAGEFVATRSQLVTAPAVGGNLRLVQLSPTGSRVKAGDIVMRFDTAEQEFTLEISESEVLEAGLELEKLDADRQVQAAQDEVNLLKARFDVRKAELDVTTNELLSEVDARKNELTLDETRRKLSQIEEDVQSRVRTSAASRAVAEEKRQKAMLSRDRARLAIDQMTVKAPFDGIVAVRQNQDASGGFFFTGMSLPDYREGDVVFPGRPVLMVLDPAAIQIRARVPEALATTVSAKQKAEVRLDGSTRAPVEATVAAVAGMADRGGFFRATTQREFDVTFAVPAMPEGVEAGRTARIRIEGTPVKNALSLPRQAVFDRDGTPTVFLERDGRFVPTKVKVVTRTQSRVIVDGLTEGARVALRDPAVVESEDGPSPTPAATTAGGAR
ncbi:MAG TPA: HlyD family efflux transporter periplasmic adaptor subunit [Luteitalea sp.]|nr:HlyD family efflux transporter periplasmic adaptor subunit [Luteitalea sp.]